jgi:uncharacterized protein YaiI (UPF0178 family)
MARAWPEAGDIVVTADIPLAASCASSIPVCREDR